MSFGVRWALTMLFSNGTPRAESCAAACCIVSQSEELPMMIPTNGFAMGGAKGLNKKAQGWRALRPGKEPVLKQRRTLRDPDDRRAGDFIVPGLLIVGERDPDEAEPGHKEREEAGEPTHDGHTPVDASIVHPHEFQTT